MLLPALFMLTTTAMAVPMGQLGTRLGKRRVLAAGMAAMASSRRVFTAGPNTLVTTSCATVPPVDPALVLGRPCIALLARVALLCQMTHVQSPTPRLSEGHKLGRYRQHRHGRIAGGCCRSIPAATQRGRGIRPLCARSRPSYFFSVRFAPHPHPHAAGVAASAFAFSPRITGLRPTAGLVAMAAASLPG
jgi:MFS family permease